MATSSPPFIPVEDYTDAGKFDDADALQTGVVDGFVAFDLTVAGGVPPYTCTVVDDPLDPDDDQGLPVGVNFQIDSCSISGAPAGENPTGRPYRMTIRVIDSQGQVGDRKIQWRVNPAPVP